ncbi:MAG: hypothetical protein HY301_16160 [Verrucomicrobia bacterium]|nr:hypothetical protein [Verrucomicrobiota bacterium]
MLADVFHTRRVKWCARQLAQPAGCDVRVMGMPTPECNGTNWYRKERGLIAFENEAVLCAFYKSKY